MCLKQKPKYMCDFFFFFLQASSHIYTLEEKRQVRHSESSAFGFISKENKQTKKANTQIPEITLKVKAKSRV